jgi:ribosome biogenesis GTPase
VLTAVEEGRLSAERLDSFHTLQKELRYLSLKQDQGALRAERQRWKTIQKTYRQFQKGKFLRK